MHKIITMKAISKIIKEYFTSKPPSSPDSFELIIELKGEMDYVPTKSLRHVRFTFATSLLTLPMYFKV